MPARTAPPRTRSHPIRRRGRWAAVAVAGVLLVGGCGPADVAQQQLEQAVDAVGASARAQAEDLLNETLSSLPGEQLEVSEANRAAFQDLRTDLEQVNSQVLALLAAPQDLTQAALAPLQDKLAALQASVQEQAAELTGISVAEQQAWATLAQSVQTTATQLESLATLLG